MRTMYLLGLATTAACSGTDGGGSNTVTIYLPNAPSAVVAFRDGEGPWSVSTAMPTLTFKPLSGAYTVVVGCVLQDQRDVSVYAATTAELSRIEWQRECGVERQTIMGQVVGLDTAPGAWIYAGLRAAAPVLPDNLNYRLVDAPRGMRDLIAARRTPFGTDRVVIRRRLSVGASPVTADVDFLGTDAVDTVTHPITLSETTTAKPTVYSWLWTAGGTWTNKALQVDTAGVAFGVPSSALEAGDLHVIQIEEASLTPGLWRSITWAVHDLADRTISAPPASAAPATVSAVNQAATVALGFNWPTAPDAPLYRFGVTQYSSSYVSMEAIVSRDAFASHQYSMPDLTGVEGWDPSLGLVSGSNFDWYASSETGAPLAEMTVMLPTKEATIYHSGWKGRAAPQ